MNGRLAKKIRQEARRRDLKILPELKSFINAQAFPDRLRIAWRIVQGRF